MRFLVWAQILSRAVSAQLIFKPQNNFQPLEGKALSIPIDLTPLLNNQAFGSKPNESNFDGLGEFIPPPNFTFAGLDYRFASYAPPANDNVIAIGQKISIPRGRYLSVSLLAASEKGMVLGTINSSFSDGSSGSSPVLVPAWWSWPYPTGGDLVFPFRLTNETTDWNKSNIFRTETWLDSSKDIEEIVLPNVTGGAATDPGGASIKGLENETRPILSTQYARSTQKWVDESVNDTEKTQIFEVVINNAGLAWVLRNHSVNVHIESAGVQTIKPGYIKRLRSGDQTRVSIGVRNKLDVPSGSMGAATVILTGNGVITSNYTFNATFGIEDYAPTYESIYKHEAPDWYNGAKYGIFIHWGVYSVPGWGNVGKNETYAEWYWSNLNKGPNTKDRTYQYHEQTYSPNVVYDDFIQNFTASAFDPKEWVDLFADAGATYFVQVSKHHDGYALFDLPANVTRRTSVAQFPHRDLVQELFQAADRYQPHLHRATYYSLPEWFHPDYKEYGFSSWPGGNATNPFTNVTLPYAGYVHVNDYVSDLIIPEMNTLADLGIEIMWCDIGGPNQTTKFASGWFNKMARKNKQVLMNARCGLPGDFDTPEYARYASVQPRKYESSQGMDPYSYGYNRATPEADYMNASTIVRSLVDIVSKNGNFLLDIGPLADGSILDVEKRNLREAGRWIRSHAEAIFDTTYWHVTPQEGDYIRFTATADAFYIMVTDKINKTLVLESPIPWAEGDAIQIVGGNMSGQEVKSYRDVEGKTVVHLSEQAIAADKFTWVFKIEY